MVRLTIYLAVATFAGVATPQPIPSAPQFEVASIKPSPPQRGEGADLFRWSQDAGLFTCENCDVSELIRRAFGLRSYEFSEPEWMAATRFMISAKIPDGATDGQFRLMLQNLLVDRFKLAYHYEKKEMRGCKLLVAKGGPKIKESEGPPPPEDDPPSSDQPRTDGTGFPILPPGRRTAGAGMGRYFTERFADEPIEKLASILSFRLGIPVMNATGLKGRYDFTVRWIIGDPSPNGPRPTFAQAVQEQLGLKLQKTRVQAEILVVDHIERTPTEN